MKFVDSPYIEKRRKEVGQSPFEYLKENFDHLIWNGICVKTTSPEEALRIDTLCKENGLINADHWDIPTKIKNGYKSYKIHIGGRNRRFSDGWKYYNSEG